MGDYTIAEVTGVAGEESSCRNIVSCGVSVSGACLPWRPPPIARGRGEYARSGSQSREGEGSIMPTYRKGSARGMRWAYSLHGGQRVVWWVVEQRNA
eukprot:3934782-Pyramimonas_sp.AAC.1